MSIKPVVVQNIERAAADVCAGLAAHGVCGTYDAYGKGLLAPYLRPVVAGVCIAGPAVTIHAPPCDNWTVHIAVEQLRPGDVPIVAVESPCNHSYLGDLVATSIRARGGIGIVIDAGVRDVAELKTMQFPVWAKTVHAKSTIKKTAGAVNVPIVCAGVAVNPGDVVVADDDGVCVVAREEAAAVLARAQERTAKEEDKRRRLAAGELALDIDGMREKLARTGIKYI